MISEALTELAEQLTAAGVPADVDPATVPVPGAWIQADRLKSLTLDGQLELGVEVHLIARDDGTRRALEQLEQLLATALTIIDPRGDVQLDNYVATPQGKLPAFTIPTRVYT